MKIHGNIILFVPGVIANMHLMIGGNLIMILINLQFHHPFYKEDSWDSKMRNRSMEPVTHLLRTGVLDFYRTALMN